MKIGITQLAQLTVQALDHQVKSLSQQFPHQVKGNPDGEALYLRIHAEAEKSRAALRLLMRDALDGGHAPRRAGGAENPQQETAHAIRQAQAALERIVRQHLPHKIAA